MKMGKTISLGVGLVFVLGVAAGAMAESPSPEPSAQATALASPGMAEASPGASPEASVEASPGLEEVGMQLTSKSFEHEGVIPRRFSCDRRDISPELTLTDVPAETVSLVMIMDDPDAPGGTWDHWVAYDIPPLEIIPEAVEELGTPGTNSWGRSGYGGPCPPSGSHRYLFVVYALDTELGLEPGADKAAVLEALEDHVLAEATLLGTYSR